MPPPLPHPVEIRYLSTASWGRVECARAEALLDDGERARHGRFRFDEDRRDYAAAHALLREALSARWGGDPRGWRFEIDARGKPHLAPSHGTPATFSLSHTRGLVACAVHAGSDVGIDVERLDRAVETGPLAARFFSGEESAWLAGLPASARTAAFSELWTLKEAHAKALGLGLALGLGSTAFDLGVPGVVGGGPEGWRFAIYAPGDGLRLAVAARRETGFAVTNGDMRPIRMSPE